MSDESLAARMESEHYASLRQRELAEERRQRLLADLAAEGSARCCYAPGCLSPEQWVDARCDCKYMLLNVGLPRSGEQTGCCEMRTAYRVLSGQHA